MRYTVRPGDTLTTIATRHDLSVADVLRVNPLLPDPERLYPGQSIYLPRRAPNQLVMNLPRAEDIAQTIPAPRPRPTVSAGGLWKILQAVEAWGAKDKDQAVS